jgi:hypothetical protein
VGDEDGDQDDGKDLFLSRQVANGVGPLWRHLEGFGFEMRLRGEVTGGISTALQNLSKQEAIASAKAARRAAGEAIVHPHTGLGIRVAVALNGKVLRNSLVAVARPKSVGRFCKFENFYVQYM